MLKCVSRSGDSGCMGNGGEERGQEGRGGQEECKHGSEDAETLLKVARQVRGAV